MRAMRSSDEVVKYAYTWWSVPKSGDTARPSSPPSPAGATPGTVPRSFFSPVFASIRVIVPLSREPTRRSPPGRAASPQGEFSPSVSVETTLTEPLAGGWSAGGRETDGDGDGDVAADAVGECAG